MSQNILSVRVGDIPQYVADEVTNLGKALLEPTRKFVSQAGRTLRNSYACDYALQAVSSTITLIDLEKKTEQVTRPMFDVLQVARQFYSATRILSSIQHVVSGMLYKDFIEGRVIPVITEVAFFVGRGISTLQWCAKQKLIDLQEFANKARNIGGAVAYSVAKTVTGSGLMNSAFLVGLLGLAAQDVQGIQRGEKLVSNTLSVVSLSAEVAAIALGFVGFSNLYLMTTLSIIAASCGVSSWAADPQNWK